MKRRDSLKLMALGGAAVALPGCTSNELQTASKEVHRREPDGSFSAYEWNVLSADQQRTLRVLVDDILPEDSRSGSASEARVPEFIDFMCGEHAEMQTPVYGGLAWLDRESLRAYRVHYSDCSTAQRHALLDRIAWPDSAAEKDLPGVEFFTLARDLTAYGFWTSEMGMKDIGFLGNSPNPEWTGCSAEALAHAERIGS